MKEQMIRRGKISAKVAKFLVIIIKAIEHCSGSDYRAISSNH